MVRKYCRTCCLYLAFILMTMKIGALETVLTRPSRMPLFGFAIEGYPIEGSYLESLKEESQISPDIILFYVQWPALKANYQLPLESLNAIAGAQSIPCITWEPFYFEGENKITVPYEAILRGDYDNYLTAFASSISRFRGAVLLRFAHEMNLSVYHWGTESADYNEKSPEIYIKMFRYVVDHFRHLGVDNVAWVFCPNVDSIPNAEWNQIKAYYPGDEYVNLLGMDGYNWNDQEEVNHTGFKRRSFEEIFLPIYQTLKGLNSGKPIMVFETATPGVPHFKQAWVIDAMKVAKKWGLWGVVWFQVNKEFDWRLNFLSSDNSYVGP